MISPGPTYVNLIWGQAYGTLLWYQGQPYGSDSPALALLTSQSLTNAAGALETAALIQAMQSQSSDLQSILGLPIIFGPVSACIVDRLNSLDTLITALTSGLPQISQSASALLNMGMPSVNFIDYIAYFSSYSGEASPEYGVSGVLSNVSQWASAVNILQTYFGNMPNNLLDTASVISSACAMTSNIVYNFASGATLPQVSYNQLYSLPSTFFAANTLSQNMGSINNQQSIVAIYAMRTLASQIQETLLIASAPQTQAPINTVTVMGNETLQDVAARALGNFEFWETLASLNGIIPGSNVPAGTQLFLPPISPSGQTAVNYNINVLGRDINIGPTNGIMPPWVGDFQTILGPNNLIYALGRRLQTTLGQLVFHTDYGSRIPPEVGAVQTLQTSQQINAFGKSALLSDPRVSQISQAGVTSGTGYGVIQFNATVIPVGPASNPVQINEVISPV